jgi:hypothetical protein
MDRGRAEDVPDRRQVRLEAVRRNLRLANDAPAKVLDKAVYLIQWEKKDCAPITLAAPQFRAEGLYDQLVYELDDIRDMLSRLGGNGFGGHELLAKRQPGDCE